MTNTFIIVSASSFPWNKPPNAVYVLTNFTASSAGVWLLIIQLIIQLIVSSFIVYNFSSMNCSWKDIIDHGDNRLGPEKRRRLGRHNPLPAYFLRAGFFFFAVLPLRDCAEKKESSLSCWWMIIQARGTAHCEEQTRPPHLLTRHCAVLIWHLNVTPPFSGVLSFHTVGFA